MGRWKKNKKQNGKRQNRPGRDKQPATNYVELVRENKSFETYYKAQNLVPECEWDSFITCLKTDLPAAFRLTGTKSQAKSLLQVMQHKFFGPLSEINEVASEDLPEGEEPIKPLKPICLPWYPDGLAWQLNLTRRNIRRSETYWRLHQFLISETETGNISRQEAVSMLPPLVLGVKPNHKVLDMCAAPGSKTSQIIEFLHRSDDGIESTIPPGVVVANDVDNKRCYMLTHQTNRLQSPAVLITNHDAAFMPNLFHTRSDGSIGPMKFDRILCDVPCSGDGTLRKNYDVWSKWNMVNGANLHGLQLRIARRGLEMLEVGGRLVYSTCSLNPLENEAVISRLLQDFQGCVQLIDVRDQLPGLKTCPGMEQWTLMNRELEVINSPDDIPLKCSNLFHKHLFPPPDDLKPALGLTKCVRVMPHYQDTGGFFVAVLEKIKPLVGEKVYISKAKTAKDSEIVPTITDNNTTATTTKTNTADVEIKTNTDDVTTTAAPAEVSTTSPSEVDLSTITKTTDSTISTTPLDLSAPPVSSQRIKPPPNKKRCLGFREEPYYYLDKDDPLWPNISSFFKICDSINPSMFLSRNLEGKRRTLYFTNPLIKDLISLNQHRMKIINTGVKALVRSDNKGAVCDFRLAQDGSHVMLPLIKERKINISKDDLEALLLNDDMEAPPEIVTMHTNTQAQCATMNSGSAAFIYNGEGTDKDPIKIELVGWKGKQSLRAYVARNDRIHFLRLIDGNTSKYEKNKFALQRNKVISTNGADGESKTIPDESVAPVYVDMTESINGTNII